MQITSTRSGGTLISTCKYQILGEWHGILIKQINDKDWHNAIQLNRAQLNVILPCSYINDLSQYSDEHVDKQIDRLFNMTWAK